MIWISETYLDSCYADDDTRLNIEGFTLIRADSSHNCKTDWVSIYFKEHLAVHPVSSLNLNKCLTLEIYIQNKKWLVIFLYPSSSQSKDEFDHFLLTFEQHISGRMRQNAHFMLVTAGFSARSSPWWKNDPITSEGNQIDALTSSYGLSQLTREPTHILPNSSSCIDQSK